MADDPWTAVGAPAADEWAKIGAPTGGDDPWAAVGAPIAQPGFLGRNITQPLKQGFQQVRQEYGVGGALSAIDRKARLDQIDVLVKSKGPDAAAEYLKSVDPTQSDTDSLRYLGSAARGDAAGTAAIRQATEAQLTTGATQAATAGEKLAGMPDDLAGITTLSQLGSKIMEDPMILVRLGLSSAPQAIPGIIAAPAAGPAGIGLGSMGVETASSLVDSMKAAGIDTTNPDAIRQALTDPAFMATAKAKAESRGMAVGAFDALTAGIGGTLVRGSGVKQVLARTGIEATGGAAGEAAAQTATEGRITSPVAVAIEGIAEVPGGVAESTITAAQTGNLRSGDKGNLPASEGDLAGLLAGTGSEVALPPDTVQSRVDLRQMIPSERPLTLGPEQELPRESQFQTTGTRPFVSEPTAQQTTADFYARSGAVPEAIVSGKKPYATPQVSEIPAGDWVAPKPGARNPVLDTITAAAERERQGLASRLAALPGVRGLVVGATRVKGDARAVGLARRASLLNTQATQALAEGRKDEAVRLRAQAARVLEKASAAGFEYVEPLEHTLDATIREGVTGVARPAPSSPAGKLRKQMRKLEARTGGDSRLRVAVMREADRKISVGNPGQLHSDLPRDESSDYLDGFVDLDTGRFLDRAEAAKLFKQRTGKTEVKTGEVGDLDALDLRSLATRISEPGTQGGAGPRTPFSQDPTVFDNPLVMLEAGLDRAATPQGKDLWSMGSERGLAGAIGFVRSLKSRLLPNLKLIIDTRSDSPFASLGAQGSYAGFRGDWGVIWLPESTMNDSAKVATVLSHELGHALIHQHWAQTDTATQQAIYAAFGRHLATSFGAEATARQFLNDLHNPVTLAIVNQVYKDQLTQPSVDFLQNSHYASWWSFDEWIAEQASKWMFTNRRTVTLLDRFFKSLGNAMEKVLRTLGRRLETFQPPKEVKLWLDSLLERRALAQGPLTASGTLDSYRRGVQSNALALGEPLSAATPPPQAETLGLRRLQAFGFPAKRAAQADRWGFMARIGTHLYQIAANNPHIAGLRNYLESARQWNATKIGLISRSVSRLRTWRKLGKEMGGKLSEFMYDIDSLSYIPPGQNARWPTNAELLAMAKKHGLNRAAFQVYLDIRNDFLDVTNRIEAAWVKDAQRTITNPQALANALAQIKAEMAGMRVKPYFPHERFGKWTVTVRDSSGKVVDHAQRESRRAAIAHAKAITPQFPGHDVSTGKLPEDMQVFSGLPPSLLKSMQNRLGLTSAQQKALEGLIFDLSPANSAVKRFKRRKGTPGFSLDSQRAYASYFQHIGGHIARLDHAADMQAGIQEVKDTARTMRGLYAADDVSKRNGIAEWMERHFQYIMNPQGELQALKSLTFFYHLGFNASSAALNLTQIPMVAYPYMGARFGDVRAMNALRKASIDLRKLFRLDPKALSQDEVDAVSLGVSQLFLEESLAAEIAGYAQGGVLDRMIPGNGLQRGTMALARASGWMFQMVEKVNRRVTFMAAYRLAKADPGNKAVLEVAAANPRQYQELLGKGWTPANAGAFLLARDAVDRSMFEYSALARPEALRGKKGALFAFWMFKQNYLWFMKNDPGALRSWIVLLATAGIMGLPFAEDLSDLAKLLASMGGKHFDPEVELRAWIADAVGKEEADIALHGMARDSFGLSWAGDMLGIPVPSVDVSHRLGMGQVIPGAEPLLDPNLDFNDRIAMTVMQASGAGYGIPLTVIKAMESGDPNTFKMYERMLPAAARNLARMFRYIEQGETVRSGAQIAEFDVTDSVSRAELVAQGLGFAPTKVARQWDMRAAMQDTVKFWSIQRGMLFDAFADAQRGKDREALADVREAIRKFNAEAPDPKLRISAKSLLSSLKARARKRRADESERSTTYPNAARSVREAFPE